MSKKYNLFLISLNESLCQFTTMPVKDVQMNRYQIMIKRSKYHALAVGLSNVESKIRQGQVPFAYG